MYNKRGTRRAPWFSARRGRSLRCAPHVCGFRLAAAAVCCSLLTLTRGALDSTVLRLRASQVWNGARTVEYRITHAGYDAGRRRVPRVAVAPHAPHTVRLRNTAVAFAAATCLAVERARARYAVCSCAPPRQCCLRCRLRGLDIHRAVAYCVARTHRNEPLACAGFTVWVIHARSAHLHARDALARDWCTCHRSSLVAWCSLLFYKCTAVAFADLLGLLYLPAGLSV